MASSSSSHHHPISQKAHSGSSKATTTATTTTTTTESEQQQQQNALIDLQYLQTGKPSTSNKHTAATTSASKTLADSGGDLVLYTDRVAHYSKNNKNAYLAKFVRPMVNRRKI